MGGGIGSATVLGGAVLRGTVFTILGLDVSEPGCVTFHAQIQRKVSPIVLESSIKAANKKDK